VPEEVEPSLLDEASNAVRIMTIHAAKGLEFDTVILPDVEFRTPGSGPDFFTVDEPPSLVMRNGIDTLSGVCRRSGDDALKEIFGKREEAETRRLFYVAITRAKSQVVIACKKKPQRTGFGRYLVDIFGVDPTMWSADRSVRNLPIGPVALEVIAGAPASSPAAPPAFSPAPPCVVPQPPPMVIELSRGEIAIARAGSAKRSAGIVLHRVLERWDGQSDVEPLLTAIAVEQAADDDCIALVRRRLATVSRSQMLQRIAHAQTIGREMPISFLDEGGAIVEKRIDRLIREDGVSTVIDYKSGAPSPERLVGDREQVAMYCRAVERMTGNPCQGALWYIDDDNDAVVDVT
jgi:ATP-dependent helicase/nuclease subunit A